MKHFLWIFLLFIDLTVLVHAQAPTKEPETFVIRKPTIVAFFVPVTQSEIDNDEGMNETLSDFQYYVGSVRDTLINAGIEFHEADAWSFKIRVGKKLRIYRTKKAGVGYYFIAPGKEPNVKEGVMTDQDLLDEARKYFGLAIR
jgi:hypothetical protein